MKILVCRFLALSGLLMLAAACQPIQGNSLLTDSIDGPSSHVLNKEPRAQELYLKAGVQTISAPSTVTQAEISGECYVSTYPNHSIVVLESGVQLDIVDLNPATDINAKKAACRNGKFNFAINTGNLSIGVHSLRLVLQAWDSKGQLVVNEVQGVSPLTLTK